MAGEKSFLKKEFIRTMRKDLDGVPVPVAPIPPPVSSAPLNAVANPSQEAAVTPTPGPVVNQSVNILENNDVLQAELKEREAMEEKVRQEEEKEKEEKVLKEIAWQKELDKIKLGSNQIEENKVPEQKAVLEVQAPKAKEAITVNEAESARLEAIRKELEEKEKQKEEEKRKRELLEKEMADRISKEQELKRKAEEANRLEELKKKEEEEKQRIEMLKKEEEMRRRLEALQREAEQRKKEVERLKQEEERKRKAEEAVKKRAEEAILRREDLARRVEELKIKEEENRKIKELGKRGVLGFEEDQEDELSPLDREREASAKMREQIRREDLERKIKEERLRKEQDPEIRKRFLMDKKRKLELEKIDLQKELRQIALQKKPLEGPKMALLKEIDGIRKASKAIFDKEQKIKEEEEIIEKKEAEAQTAKEKKQIEKSRWAIEDKRRNLEMRRWPWEEKMKEINERIKRIDFQFSGFEEKEDLIRIKEKEISTKEENINLEIEQLGLRDRQEKINEIKKILDDEKRALFDDIDAIEEKLGTVYQEESTIEDEVKAIEEEEKETKDFEVRKKLEKKRWAGEEKRRKVESNKWQLENEKESKENQLRSNEEKANDLLQKEKEVVRRIEEIEKTINIVATSGEPVETSVPEVPEIGKDKEEEKKEEESVEIKKEEPVVQKKTPIKVKEVQEEKEINPINSEESEAEKKEQNDFVNGLESKVIESQKIEKEKKYEPRAEDESLKKDMQDLAGVEIVAEAVKEGPNESTLKIEEAKKRLEELKKANILETDKNEKIKEEIQSDLRDEKKQEVVESVQPVQKIVSVSPQQQEAEKEKPVGIVKETQPSEDENIDLSKPSNGKTMMGSVAVDNEEERARKELIAKLQTRPSDKRFASVASSVAVSGNIMPEAKKGDKNKPNSPSEMFSGGVPQKPSGKEKLWTRVGIFGVILALLAAVVTFWYWWFRIKTQPPPVTIECTETSDCTTNEICKDGECVKSAPKCTTNTDCATGQTCDASGNCVASGSIVEASPPLFGVDVSLTREASISSLEEIKSLLSQWVQEDQEKNTFRRLLIKTSDNKYVSLKDIFNSIEVRVPANFYSNFGDNYTLFSYSQTEGNRLGVVVEVAKTEDLSNSMRAEESVMKEDFIPLLNLIHTGDPTKVQQFRDAISLPGYKGPNFRFLTTSTKDLGLCYLVSQDRFIFTTSLTSIENLVERMAIEMPVVELAKDLNSKSTGDDVKLLQTWLASDASIFTGKVTGTYDIATQEAVKKFQNKYASEILAPQGLYEGTGDVDERTRMKLNELYAKSGIRPRGTELINDLRFGASGDEVRLLQTWLAKDSTIYPEGLVTGWFGSLTERAVKKFQEKFDKEILIPNGLSKGTGVVDKATRAKLNSLYKK